MIIKKEKKEDFILDDKEVSIEQLSNLYEEEETEDEKWKPPNQTPS